MSRCRAAVGAQFDVLFLFIFVQLCQHINACYLPTHSSSIRSVLVIKVGLHWASATQWAVKSTLHAFSKHGSKPHIVVAGTVKMPVSLKKKVAEWYKHDNDELWRHKRGGFVHTLCPSTVIAGHQWTEYLEHLFYGTHARRSCAMTRPCVLFSYPNFLLTHVSKTCLTGYFGANTVTYRAPTVWAQHHFVLVSRHLWVGTKCKHGLIVI